MKFLFDLFPVILFFLAFKLWGIYAATTVAIAGTVAQVAWLKLRGRKVETTLWISLVIIVIFGGATLFLQDESFIKWKPTVLYGAMAIGLMVTVWLLKKNFLKLMLGSQLELPDPVWQRLNLIWIGYCCFMAGINGYVAAYYSTEDWVNFKLWGYAFPLAFILGQGLYIARYLKSDGPET
jgi:intracellular septation protein